jgi:uncharacterized heparinase superfamily protein
VKPSELGRLLRTVRHLRPAQIAGQLARPLRSHRPRRAGGEPARLRVSAPATAFLDVAPHAHESDRDRVAMLHRSLAQGERVDWEHGALGPLWQFHLHYHDWLRAPGFSPAERAVRLRDWMERHRDGVGWHPAPISLRAFVWAKLLLAPQLLPRDPALAAALAASLADQLATLAANRERDLLANHYLFNLLALVLGGLLLEGAEAERWLRFEGDLRAELAEQILADGAHCERSPMYHALVLEAVLDVLNVAATATGRLSAETGVALRDCAARMLGAHAVWTHPDGEIALFGDSAFAIAPAPRALADYAGRLGVRAAGPRTAGLLDAAGYVRLADGPFTLIASVAGPMPPYQPGHAHCDALGFELSIGSERVVTDTGVYEYAPGARRDQSRATRSHATLALDGQEQAELWGAHRVGGRPRVALERAELPHEAEATCRGWSRPDLPIRRRFAIRGDELRIDDEIGGAARRVEARLPLAPGLAPRLAGARAELALLHGGVVAIELPADLAWRVETAPYYPEFGRETPRACLVGEGAANRLAWRLRSGLAG